MGNAPPEGLSPKDDAEAAQWAEEDAQAMRMPRYVPVASLGNYERPTMQQIRDMFLSIDPNYLKDRYLANQIAPPQHNSNT